MIKFNEPFEVSEQAMKTCAKLFRGIVAYRKSEGRFWLICWHGGYLKELREFLRGSIEETK